MDAIVCLIPDYLTSKVGSVRTRKPFNPARSVPYYQSAQSCLAKRLTDRGWSVTTSNLLGQIVHNSQLTLGHFESRDYNVNATKKQLGWIYQSLAQLCAVRCQGGFLGFSCCHGSAVTVYGHSYCCEECNSWKVPKRHLKSLTRSLQRDVRQRGPSAIVSPDLRFYHKMEALSFHKDTVVQAHLANNIGVNFDD